MSASNTIPLQSQMKLLTIMREICSELQIPFGHGMRSYANLQTRRGIYETEKKFPRAYLYPVNINDNIVYGNIKSTYECYMDVLNLCAMKSTQDEIESVLYDMHLLSSNFLQRLVLHPEVDKVEAITREPNYHIFDENLCGWVLRFDITLIEPYPC
jgi:hypothetical protein